MEHRKWLTSLTMPASRPYQLLSRENSPSESLSLAIVMPMNVRFSACETTRHYAAIRLELKLTGKPIPANDLWIAALSRRHAMPVVTRDAHFDSVAGLSRRTW
jgi:predicted nucleic acid-binding protein